MARKALAVTLSNPRSQQIIATLAGVIYLLPLALVNVDLYDEGIRLYGAMRVLQGAQPYHDFFAYYGPSEFYWPAALFALFGEQLVVARLGSVFFALVAVWSILVLLRQAGVGWRGLCLAVMALLVPFDVLPSYAANPALSLGLGAAAIIAGGLSVPRLLTAGAMIGAAITFRQDFGAYAAVACVAMLAVFSWQSADPTGSARIWLERTAILATAASFIAALVYGPLLARGAHTVWECLVSEIIRLMRYRRFPYRLALERELGGLALGDSSHVDELRTLLMLAPVGALLGLLALLWPALRRSIGSERVRTGVLVFLIVFAAGLWVYASGRSDHVHAYPLYLAVMMLVVLIGASGLRLSKSRGLSFALGALLAILVAAFARDAVANWQVFWAREPASLARARGIRMDSRSSWLETLVEDVERHAADRPIFVAAARHDRVHKSLMIAYFLTGRSSATYYPDLLPGLIPMDPVQARMIAELEASDARVVVVWPTALPTEPNLSATERGSKRLDRYLARQFRPEVSRPRYRLLLRRR